MLTGTVNLLAPVVTGVFLLAFTLINLVCFAAAVSRPNFAPQFRFYSKSCSLFGTVLSLSAMVVSLTSTTLNAAGNAVTGLVCALLALLLFWRRKPLLALLMKGVFDREVEPFPGVPGSLVVEERFQRAEFYVRDAMQGRFRAHIWDNPTKRTQTRLLLRNFRLIRMCNMAVYMCIGFVERPAWCYGTDDCGATTAGVTSSMASVPVSGFPVLPIGVTQLIESICVAFFLAEMGLKVHYMTPTAYFASPWHLLQLLILCLDAAGICISAISPVTATFLNPMLRPLLFIVMSSSVRSSFGSFLRVIPVRRAATGTLTTRSPDQPDHQINQINLITRST